MDLELELKCEGLPLADLGLDKAVVVYPDGREEPYKGFVAASWQSIPEAISASLAEGASLLVKPDA